MKVPCKVYYPRDNGKPPKELTAATQDEHEGLMRVGWSPEPPKETK